MAEEAFRQVGGAQAVSPARRPAQVGQQAMQLVAELLDHLRLVGWTKATELAKVARRDGQQFDCATWVHKAQELPKDAFKREVERHLTGRETEPWEMLYFKVYKSQLPVIEQALETAALMLGTEKSRGYCLEMICADFIAGANQEGVSSEMLRMALGRLISFLPPTEQEKLFTELVVPT